ncbi:hypothetical protein TrST_g10853 [Triparma strigata]|uniref:N-acetyltransferase domain-containing protein n=1 Tax=Triparma strigata TaxID=1606541 RepID=A0A9W6ZFE1_9STRA|nr:hypothetical protein TrST_g10853 [Triparma strigata]
MSGFPPALPAALPVSSYISQTHGKHVIHYRPYNSELDIDHIQALCSPMLSEPYSVYTYRYFLLKFGDCCWFGFKRNDGSGDAKVPPSSDEEERRAYSCVACCICKIDTSYKIVKVPAVPPKAQKAASEGGSKPGLAGALAKIKLDREAAAAQGEDHEVEVKTGYIGMLSTDPPYRGLDIANRLLSLSIESMIENHGIRAVTLEVEDDNVKAESIYRKVGFTEEGRWKRYYLNGGGAKRLKMNVEGWTEGVRTLTVGRKGKEEVT